MKVEAALQLLGLEAYAASIDNLTPEHLRKVYLKRALATHPDKRKDDPESTHKFTSLKAAYEVALEAVQGRKATLLEQQHTSQLLETLIKALRGEDVEAELQRLGIYRPSDQFGKDLKIRFDGRLPVDESSQQGGDDEVDVLKELKNAFYDQGLNEDGDPLEGWARPPDMDYNDMWYKLYMEWM